MSDLVLVLGVAAITFATSGRIPAQTRDRHPGDGWAGFSSCSLWLCSSQSPPTGWLPRRDRQQLKANIAAAVGGVVGGVVFRRSLWGVLGVGAACFYLARALIG